MNPITMKAGGGTSPRHLVLRDVAANRPAAANQGRLYIETDSPYKVWRDNGAGWDHIGFGVTSYRSGYANELRTAERTPQCLVTFVFDDAHDTDYTKMLPLFNAQGVPAVSAIVTDSIGTANHLTMAQIAALSAAGWEIASHTKTHANLTTLTEAQIITELTTSKAVLEAAGFTVDCLVYPYGAHNATVRRIARRYYRAARAVSVLGYYNPLVLTTYALNARQADDHLALATYKSNVDSAETAGVWLIFFLHKTDDDDVITIGALIDYIQAKNIDIVTMSQALDLIGNTLDVGDTLVTGYAASERGFYSNAFLAMGGAAGGSAATPSFSFNDDPDKGMYSLGTNMLGFSTVSKLALKIDASQKLWIGETSDTNLYRYSANWLGTDGKLWVAQAAYVNSLVLADGIVAPTASAGFAKLYVDTADGDLKVIFGDGTIKTIVVDT